MQLLRCLCTCKHGCVLMDVFITSRSHCIRVSSLAQDLTRSQTAVKNITQTCAAMAPAKPATAVSKQGSVLKSDKDQGIAKRPDSSGASLQVSAAETRKVETSQPCQSEKKISPVNRDVIEPASQEMCIQPSRKCGGTTRCPSFECIWHNAAKPGREDDPHQLHILWGLPFQTSQACSFSTSNARGESKGQKQNNSSTSLGLLTDKPKKRHEPSAHHNNAVY